MEFAAQHLPPGQVERTASIRGPRDNDDLLAAQRRQAELVAVDVVEDQFGRLGADQGAAAERLGADGPQSGLLVSNQAHAKTGDGRDEVEALRLIERHTDLSLAGTLGLHLPASTGGELLGRDVERIKDHEYPRYRASL